MINNSNYGLALPNGSLVSVKLSDSETALEGVSGISPATMFPDDFPMLFNAIAATTEDDGELVGTYTSKDEANERLMEVLDGMHLVMPEGTTDYQHGQLDGKFIIFSKVVEVLPL